MSTLSSVIQRLEARSPLPPLCPKETWDENLSKEITALSAQDITEVEKPSDLAVKATRSGLLLWNDDLYTSHTLSQDIPEQVGSYWHGIMHRREADFSNAKYWFRNVGQHEIYSPLFEQASQIWPAIKDWGEWKPDLFIDEVERVVDQGLEESEEAEAFRKIQVLEFSLLLNYSRNIK